MRPRQPDAGHWPCKNGTHHSVLALTRQDCRRCAPNIPTTTSVQRGAYVVREAFDSPGRSVHVTCLATTGDSIGSLWQVTVCGSPSHCKSAVPGHLLAASGHSTARLYSQACWECCSTTHRRTPYRCATLRRGRAVLRSRPGVTFGWGPTPMCCRKPKFFFFVALPRVLASAPAPLRVYKTFGGFGRCRGRNASGRPIG